MLFTRQCSIRVWWLLQSSPHSLQLVRACQKSGEKLEKSDERKNLITIFCLTHSPVFEAFAHLFLFEKMCSSSVSKVSVFQQFAHFLPLPRNHLHFLFSNLAISSFWRSSHLQLPFLPHLSQDSLTFLKFLYQIQTQLPHNFQNFAHLEWLYFILCFQLFNQFPPLALTAMSWSSNNFNNFWFAVWTWEISFYKTFDLIF